MGNIRRYGAAGSSRRECGRAGSVPRGHIIATQLDDPRALPAAALAERWRTLVPTAHVMAVDDVGAALERGLAEGRGPVVVAGSLYLVGEARRRWIDDPLLRDPEVQATS